MMPSLITYSRESLLLLRKSWKLLTSSSSHGLLTGHSKPLSTNLWNKLRCIGILARYRGQRGGNHVRASFYPRKIGVTELSGERACYSGCKQRFSNSSNLLNIQVGTSFSNNSSGTASTKEDKKPNSTKPLQKSKVNIAHFNIHSLKNRTHLIQLKDHVIKNKYVVKRSLSLVTLTVILAN